MITLTLPNKFEDVLKKNDVYRGETLKLITKFSDWIKHNSLEFFPEYTDHGIEHIQSVLDTAEKLVNDASWDILTPEDIYVLVSAILLHDSAMYLDKYGLWSLINDDRFNAVVLGKRRDKTWIEKWEEFKKSVKKFEENDWYNFFGQFEVVNLPEIDEKNFDDKQKILLGDFIRQHHADIAETIASYGIPCVDKPIELFDRDFTSLNQLSGFIARSHNYSMRQMVDELGGDYDARVYKKTHPAFLMGVLRISDYLQFENKRTPKILFQIKGKGMCSPISIIEWKKHLSILEADQSHNDIELLFVRAFPNDVKTLEGIKKLLEGFQRELDSFWAVNGEIYSRIGELASLGLKLRRVKSNLDNPYSYVEQNNKNFYPEILSIKADNQKIFPILIGPLYGDIPQIGLRELLQNSIDACNERFSTEIKGEVHKKQIPYKVAVTIDLDNDELIIQDNGIGMDIDVVKDYFLKVGASYRYSEVWKATHLDGSKGYVPRTGKFGIGMLAGFLIGDKISVSSKKQGLSSDKGVVFTYRLDSSDIQIDFTNMDESGTIIKISSNQSNLNKILDGFVFNSRYRRYEDSSIWYSYWYYLDTPIVEFVVIENKERKSFTNPDIIAKKTIFDSWQSVKNTELDGFYWKISSFDPSLCCNGILIRNFKTPNITIECGLSTYVIDDIAINIFDNLGRFPLTLTRNGLVTKDFYEIDKLRESVLSYYFEEIRQSIQNFSWSHQNILNLLQQNNNRHRYKNTFFPMVITNKEIHPLGSEKLQNKYIVFDYLFENQKRGLIYSNNFFKLMNQRDFAYACSFDANKEAYITREAIMMFIFRKKELSSRSYYYFGGDEKNFIDFDMDISGWIFVKKTDFSKLGDTEKTYLQQKGVYDVPSKNKNWVIVATEENHKLIPPIHEEILDLTGIDSFIFAIYKINKTVVRGRMK